MASQSSSPPSISPRSPASLNRGLDHIDIPYDLDALARSEHNNDQANHLPATTAITDDAHPYGVLNSVHLRLLAGRDAHGTTVMQPATPALVTRRDDFPTARAGGGETTSHNNPDGARGRGHALDRNELNAIAHRVMTPTFPPYVEGVVETRHRSDAKMTENLRGFAVELEAAVESRRGYNEGYGAFRDRFGAAEGALAARARSLRAARAALAGRVRELHRTRARYPGDVHAGAMRGLAARLEGLQRRIRTLAAHMGLMFACGRAVDLGALPGNDPGSFDEAACSPKAYLSSILPELARRPAPAGPADPTTAGAPDLLLPPDLRRLLSPDWDFSLAGLLTGARRAGLRGLWAAALAGDWEAVEERTRGGLAVAGALLAAGTAGGEGD